MALHTTLEERGLPKASRLRDNVASIRQALAEMRMSGVLSKAVPYQEKLALTPGKRRPKITDGVWTLFPSNEFVSDVVAGNKKMAAARLKAGGNKRESRLVPGFNHLGEIGAKG
jgi:hypothetical protein